MIVLLLNIQKPDLLTDKPTDSKLTGSHFIELGPRSAITHEPEFFSSGSHDALIKRTLLHVDPNF